MSHLTKPTVHREQASDLGHVAWVVEDIRKSLNFATSAVRRVDWDAKQGANIPERDNADLHTATRQMFQSVGALEMVGHPHPAKLVRAMGQWIQGLTDRPESLPEDAITAFENACRALLDFFEGLLKGSQASPVALFAQYRAMLQLCGTERIHPADLWPRIDGWESLGITDRPPVLSMESVSRRQLDEALLPVLKDFDVVHARRMGDLCCGLAATSGGATQTFWWIAAAFFEALALGELPNDVYVRRTAARIIAAYSLLGNDQNATLTELANELLFYCAFAKLGNVENRDAAVLTEVRKVFGLDQSPPIDYASAPFGKFDPTLLAQLRKNIALAAEGWSALSAGDIGRAAAVVAQFAEVSAAVMQLHPTSEALISALTTAVEVTARQAKAPSSAIAIEVASAILYLEVAYDDLDLASHTMEQRSARLATRLLHVVAGGEPLPIEAWMEALYRRVGERKAMGTVVEELALSLAQVEKSMDAFIRDPGELLLLDTVPATLGHMRGVFSVLGLDQAALAALRMRSTVEHLLLAPKAPLENTKQWTLQLVNSLSALGFLIDMLRYQPAMAKELFVYDEEASEFRLTIEREQGPQHVQLVSYVQAFTSQNLEAKSPSSAAIPAVKAMLGAAALAAKPDTVDLPRLIGDEFDADDAEIQGIFLSEACAVLTEGKECVLSLNLTSANLAALIGLRRAFHTLKGSARMVGFEDFGEAAWAFEQLLNMWLESNRAANEVLLSLCEAALDAMQVWIEAVLQDQPPPYQAADFRLCADALRLENRYLPESLSRHRATVDPLPEESHSVSAIPGEPKTPAAAGDVETAAPLESSPPSHASASSLYQGATNAVGESASSNVNIITIGNLPLRLDVFEVFVNEAGLWVNQLQTELDSGQTTASLETMQRAAGRVHALHGSSAAVGFTGLAALAHAMERTFEHFMLHGLPTVAESALMTDAAKELNRLMDAFAGGFLAKTNPAIQQGLADLLGREAAQTIDTEPALPAVPEPDEIVVPATADFAVLEEVSAGESVNAPTPVPVPPVIKIAQPAFIAVVGANLVDLESQDVLDADLWPVFFEEGGDLLQALAKSLALWVATPQEIQLRAQTLRILHTLKGSARLAGAMRLGEIAHQMESAVERVAENASSNAAEIAPLLQYLEQLETVFGDMTPQLRHDTLEDQAKHPQELKHSPLSLSTSLGQPTPAVASLRGVVAASVRVRSQVLDRLIDQAGEVMTGRTRMEQRLVQLHHSAAELGRNLDRMRHQLRDLELQTELQMRTRQSSSPEASPLFDPLELDRFTALQEVSRMMVESVADIDILHKGLQSEVEGAQEDLLGQGRRAKELTNGLLRMRLVEFESISDRLYGVVRQAAKETGKQVRLDIEGGSIEMDRGVLDRMTPAFEHMLRNAVVHGIESPEVRVAAGKAATGAITISVQQDGSDVSVRFDDDGAGLQLEKIRMRAMEARLLDNDQTLTYEQAAKLLFIPGFSTADQVTELAGRGIGMDVVLSDIGAIGGRIETSSQSDGGTSFQLVFPLTTAVTQIVMLRMENFTIGVPANLLETVLRVTPDRIEEAYATGELPHSSGQNIPFFWAGAILGVSARGYVRTPGARQQSVAVIRSAGQRVALHVDEVLGNREVVVKNLGTQLARLPGLVGISVLASGAVVLIYNPVALMNVYGEATRRAEASALSGAAMLHAGSSLEVSRETTSPLVLVVDDSITVRRVTQRLLSRAGFRVVLASDGMQALDLLRDERPALVLSDIEMPRMDGMELTRQIRADAKLSDLPIIIITSRTAQKHRDHALALGANHYLGKPYGESELLDLVRSHCTVAEAA